MKAMTHLDGVLYIAQEAFSCNGCAFEDHLHETHCAPANANATDSERCMLRIWVRSEDQSPTAWATYWLNKE